MTTLKFEKLLMPGAELGKDGDYPLYFPPLIRPAKKSLLDDSEGLLLGYGAYTGALPYTAQSEYDRSESIREFDSYVLENEHLKAVFLPSLGGKLWSLYDKRNGQYLVMPNTVFRPCNLAVRNAWTSGGVEWNCGITGHHAFTCDKVYAASYTAKDGTPVLRIYNFERVRAVTYQLDFILPSDSDTLFVRARIVNGTDKVTPIYWWSNIAVEMKKGARIITPADETYVTEILMPLHKITLPPKDGPDTTYPEHLDHVIDYFYKMPDNKRRYEAYIGKDGVGMIHSSTRVLKGRKMFVWGNSPGGDRWQKLLTDEEGAKHPYVELQAGLAYTQAESVPLAANTALEWVEAYSPIVMKPSEVHGEYRAAMRNVEEWLDGYLPECELDRLLERYREDALKRVDYSYKGRPWGALDKEIKRALGMKEISPTLTFGELEEEQLVWHRFLKNGFLDEPDPNKAPTSFMVQDEWFDLLCKTVKGPDKFNWYAWYNIGNCHFARADYESAKEAFERSLSLKASTWAYHGLGCTYLALGEKHFGAVALVKALAMNPTCLSFSKDAIRLCNHFGEYTAVIEMYGLIPEEHRSNPLILGYYAAALAYTGKPEVTKDILERDGGLEITEIREGDDTVTLAYIHAIKEIAKKEGKEISDSDIRVPEKIDYRVFI